MSFRDCGGVMGIKRYELSEVQWHRIEPMLPGKASDPGRTADHNRLFINGVLWVLRSGARWSDLPERYGKYKTVHKRFTRWARAGLAPVCTNSVRSGDDSAGVVGRYSTLQHSAATLAPGIDKRRRWRAAISIRGVIRKLLRQSGSADTQSAGDHLLAPRNEATSGRTCARDQSSLWPQLQAVQ